VGRGARLTRDLDALAARIERVALDPDQVSAPFSRILRPILARLGVEPDLHTTKASQLIDRLRAAHTGAMIDKEVLEGALEAAKAELESNVSSVERACVVNEQPMVTSGAWLRRIYEVLVRAERAVVADEKARAMVASLDTARLLPPLTVRAVPHTPNDASDTPTARRLIELELASVDRLIDAAEEEQDLLGRKRRLFEAARRVLLDASVALPLDEHGCAGRLDHLARKIARIDRLEAAGVATDASLAHQLRQAISRGERDRAYATLCALNGAAVERGDESMLDLTSRAMRTVGGLGGSISAADSLDRSAREMFGVDIDALTKKTYAAARKKYAHLAQSRDLQTRDLAHQAARYFHDEGATALTSAAIAVDGCFDVGGAMLPIRIIEHETVVRAVRYPTKDLALLPATLDDMGDAVIEDPRTLVLDLAAGRLLARRYIAEETRDKPKIVLRGEVRAYVLDGSGSMTGPRARMRDAIVASELLTLRGRLQQHAKLAHVVLFYRYFTDKVEASHRVDSVPAIDVALGEVLGTLRTGGTDIEGALVQTMSDIAKAQVTDPDLSRAQIVLVTDGQAAVDEARLSVARETIRALPIALSVIALGEQNDALRAIVKKQRANGEHAFYHFIADDALTRISAGEIDAAGAVHPPPVSADRMTPEALASEIGELAEEIAACGRKREVEALESLDDGTRARQEVGLGPSDLSESETARARALYHDRAALERQFERWFPPASQGTTPELEGMEADDVEAATVLLATVAEMLDVVGGSDLARMADAIDLLDRLLPDARLTPARYHAVIAEHSPKLAAPIAAVRAAALGSMLIC
jgi:hypothetical protein